MPVHLPSFSHGLGSHGSGAGGRKVVMQSNRLNVKASIDLVNYNLVLFLFSAQAISGKVTVMHLTKHRLTL